LDNYNCVRSHFKNESIANQELLDMKDHGLMLLFFTGHLKESLDRYLRAGLLHLHELYTEAHELVLQNIFSIVQRPRNISHTNLEEMKNICKNGIIE